MSGADASPSSRGAARAAVSSRRGGGLSPRAGKIGWRGSPALRSPRDLSSRAALGATLWVRPRRAPGAGRAPAATRTRAAIDGSTPRSISPPSPDDDGADEAASASDAGARESREPRPPEPPAPRSRPRYRARRTSRERRWNRPIDGPTDRAAFAGSGPDPSAPDRSPGAAHPLSPGGGANPVAASGWAQQRALRSDPGIDGAAKDAPPEGTPWESSSRIDGLGDLAGVGFGGVAGAGAPASSDANPPPRALRGKALTRRIKQLGDRRQLDEVFALVAASPVPETPNGRRITVGAIIGACCKCGDLRRASSLLRELDGPGGVGAGAPSYCALMQAHGRAGRLREALALLEAWEKGRGPRSGKLGVGRGGAIYVAGSGKWRKKDVPLRSEKFKDEMGTTWHPPRTAQSRMLLTVIDACASCGDVQRARQFKDRLLRWDRRVVDGRVPFDGVSDAEAAWNAVAKAHALSSDPLSCVTVLREMETCEVAPVTPTQVSYNIAITACRRGGRPDWARALIARMRKIASRTRDPDMYPDAIAYTTAAKAEAEAARGFAGAEHAGGVEAVRAMYAEVRGPLGPPPDPQCYGAIVDAYVAYGAVDAALATIRAAELERGTRLSPRTYLGVMRAQAAAGDVEGVRRLAERLERVLAERVAARDAAKMRRALKRGRPRDEEMKKGDAAAAASDPSSSSDPDPSSSPEDSEDSRMSRMIRGERELATSAAHAASMGGDLGSGRALGASGGAAVEAEVVMCEAEAYAAAGDAAGARAALERLKTLDYAASSKVLRDRSTELLVSLFVKDIVGGRGARRKDPADAARDAARAARSVASIVDRTDVFGAVGDAFAGDASATPDSLTEGGGGGDDMPSADEDSDSMWGATQALDLIDSAWGFASLDEDDEFLPSLDEDDVPVPAAGGFGSFLGGAVRRGGWSDLSQGPYPGGGDWTSPADWTSPTLRSSEAADALELWAGAASRLFAGEAEPLFFRGGVDPRALISEEPDLGMTLDEDESEEMSGPKRGEEVDREPRAESGLGWFSSPVGAGRDGSSSFRFVVRVDEPAGPAAEAVGRDFVAVVIDGDLRPVGTLMGTADAKEIAAGIPVGDVMGPTPTSVEGETATVGDVAVICAAAALDEPVAVVDAAGRLTRVVRREDLLRNPRETRNEGLGVQGGGESAR